VDSPSRGARLDADHPENGVLIPCRFTEVAADLCASTSRRETPEQIGASALRAKSEDLMPLPYLKAVTVHTDVVASSAFVRSRLNCSSMPDS
jgi:hypothetical protein